jgi:tryptophanyl-tRNA synthetase
MKKQLAADMVNFIAPIRERVNEILNNEQYLQSVMETGAHKARKSGEKTMKLVRNAIGLNYY